MGNRVVLGLGLLVACAEPTTTSIDRAATVCGDGPVVHGMDVSYYDDSVDWTKAHAAGIDFAFIRVTDGTQYRDPKFVEYWNGARAAGVIRGAYQFFRPSQDPIAQADLLLSLVGTLERGDLPPVLDVETASGMDQATVAANVRIWLDYVEAATGRVPIVYAGLYSWPDLTGGADMTSSPLWIAQYTSAACPNIPAPWTKWMFWQHSNTGVVDGVVSGELDLNVFDGTLDQLKAYADPTPCGSIAATGGTIDDADACFAAGGPAQYMREVADAGQNGLTWTHTTQSADEANYGQWTTTFDAAGTYRVEVYTAASYATSHAADYVIHANGADQSVTIDQTAVDGWQSLGDIAFAAGGDQWIHLADNTGEATQQQLVFDAIRFTPIPTETGSDEPQKPESSGCATQGSGQPTGLVTLALVALLARRRRVTA